MAKKGSKKSSMKGIDKKTGVVKGPHRQRSVDEIMRLMKAEQRKHYKVPHKTISARGCQLCGGIHTTSEHKFHGKGSFKKTHPGK